MKFTRPLLALAIAGLLAAPSAEARGLNCGRYLRGHYGLPAQFNLARHWLVLPRSSAGPGAIVVQSRRGRALGGGAGGHVSRIVSLTGHCTAIVNDNRGTYQRDICRNLLAYVRPS